MKQSINTFIIVFITSLLFALINIFSPKDPLLALIFVASCATIIISCIAYFNSNNPFGQKIKKAMIKYPKLSIVAIINKYYEQDVFKSIYLLLITILSYIFVAQIFSFPISINFLIIFFGFILLLFLYLLVFNFRIRQGWYGGNESEAREIINFALKHSDDIDFTDDGQSKRLFNEEDIEEICLELGIPIPGFYLNNLVKQDLGRLGENK